MQNITIVKLKQHYRALFTVIAIYSYYYQYTQARNVNNLSCQPMGETLH